MISRRRTARTTRSRKAPTRRWRRRCSPCGSSRVAGTRVSTRAGLDRRRVARPLLLPLQPHLQPPRLRLLLHVVVRAAHRVAAADRVAAPRVAAARRAAAARPARRVAAAARDQVPRSGARGPPKKTRQRGSGCAARRMERSVRNREARYTRRVLNAGCMTDDDALPPSM